MPASMACVGDTAMDRLMRQLPVVGCNARRCCPDKTAWTVWVPGYSGSPSCSDSLIPTPRFPALFLGYSSDFRQAGHRVRSLHQRRLPQIADTDRLRGLGDLHRRPALFSRLREIALQLSSPARGRRCPKGG
ncbi:hypothetical protein XFF6166_80008 [Xanthomonas citri pv. fuscans]|nr:hypothetical protein XFF6166_80008 [Xanthomonas citri pv. fuscans]SON99830.1 hypothetical protein XFF6960_200105 [Xanthomonas citri pv. fuscans]SOO03119.1 hypothetical protein XFF7767_150008 [Xanthomonas citri pv. fuscans]SOO09320.1 hypothetical protein XFF6970_330103 [Xanthomonas citri pv. fuscans]SOO15583.1 hypothetical protein XFF7766_600008 [Xanthomonas citri pv. fuscans]